MRPYTNKRLISYPDIADIHLEGRNTSAGGKDYLRNRRLKAEVRRVLKRSDKAKSLKALEE